MTPAAVCTKCKADLPLENINAVDLPPCPACGAQVETELFPAFFRPPQRGSSGETLILETQASCFFHPQKQAAVVCGSCGRFLCALCDVELEGQHLCPSCLEAAQKNGRIKSLENRRVLNDTIALHLALFAVLMWFAAVIIAPLALYRAIKHWNTPSSILHRSKARFVAAIVIASLEILAMIGIIIAIIFK
jgi:hypothetical protein